MEVVDAEDLEQAESTPMLLPESMEETEEDEEEDSADGEVQGAEIIILEGEVGVGSAAKEGSVGVVVTEEDPRR